MEEKLSQQALWKLIEGERLQGRECKESGMVRGIGIVNFVITTIVNTISETSASGRRGQERREQKKCQKRSGCWKNNEEEYWYQDHGVKEMTHLNTSLQEGLKYLSSRMDEDDN